jgi:hypothetical protein
MFTLGTALAHIDQMKQRAWVEPPPHATIPALAGKYEVDPDTMEPGLRLRRKRTMQP